MSDLTKAQIKFLFWFFISSAALIVFAVIYFLFSQNRKDYSSSLSESTKVLQDTLDIANENYMIEKAKIKLEAEEAKVKLEEIGKIEDGILRRKALAELLR